jgi:hypothetical protein
MMVGPAMSLSNICYPTTWLSMCACTAISECIGKMSCLLKNSQVGRHIRKEQLPFIQEGQRHPTPNAGNLSLPSNQSLFERK